MGLPAGHPQGRRKGIKESLSPEGLPSVSMDQKATWSRIWKETEIGGRDYCNCFSLAAYKFYILGVSIGFRPRASEQNRWILETLLSTKRDRPQGFRLPLCLALVLFFVALFHQTSSLWLFPLCLLSLRSSDAGQHYPVQGVEGESRRSTPKAVTAELESTVAAAFTVRIQASTEGKEAASSGGSKVETAVGLPLWPGSCTSYNSVLGLPQGFLVPTWSFGDLHKFTFFSGLPSCGMGRGKAPGVSSGDEAKKVIHIEFNLEEGENSQHSYPAGREECVGRMLLKYEFSWYGIHYFASHVGKTEVTKKYVKKKTVLQASYSPAGSNQALNALLRAEETAGSRMRPEHLDIASRS
ncbi:hypothetical protein ACRRTK_018704 [Alexandromys fortis]